MFFQLLFGLALCMQLVLGISNCSQAQSNTPEASGSVMWPRGEVFGPLVADPKSPGSYVSLLFSSSSSFSGDIAAIGIGDDFGIWRWTNTDRASSLQLGLEAGVFSQFDLQTQGVQLVNSDYVVGIPLTVRRGGNSARLRFYHQSSHLGDDYLLLRPAAGRNLSFESVELLLSKMFGRLRLYGGGEVLLHHKPSDLGNNLLHYGGELQSAEFSIAGGFFGASRFVAGVDVKSLRRESWSTASSGKLGLEFRSTRLQSVLPSRLALLFEFYHGWSPYGQFYRERFSYTGFGIHFAR